MDEEIPLADLSIRGTELALCLNLFRCTPSTMRIKGHAVAQTLEEGRKVAENVDLRLARRAVHDQAAFALMRETLREQLIWVCHDAGPPAKALGAALLWLHLHEPTRRVVVRKAIAQCLSDKRAVVQIACGGQRAYAVAIGVNPRDMRPLVAMAEKAVASETIMYCSETLPPSRLH